MPTPEKLEIKVTVNSKYDDGNGMGISVKSLDREYTITWLGDVIELLAFVKKWEERAASQHLDYFGVKSGFGLTTSKMKTTVAFVLKIGSTDKSSYNCIQEDEVSFDEGGDLIDIILHRSRRYSGRWYEFAVIVNNAVNDVITSCGKLVEADLPRLINEAIDRALRIPEPEHEIVRVGFFYKWPGKLINKAENIENPPVGWFVKWQGRLINAHTVPQFSQTETEPEVAAPNENDEYPEDMTEPESMNLPFEDSDSGADEAEEMAEVFH